MIDAAMQKFGIQDDKLYYLTSLYNVLYEIGLTRMKRKSFTADWFNRKLVSGEIVLPERKGKSRWKLSGKQIRDIVKAYMPGGVEEYRHE